MDLHSRIMNLNPKKHKQDLAIDDAIKNFKNMKDILVAVYARGFRDARHAASEIADEQVEIKTEIPFYLPDLVLPTEKGGDE